MHEQYLQQAVDLAENNVKAGKGGPYGAVIVKSDRVLSACANQVTALLDPTAHAEIAAIRQACKKLNDFQLTGCVLYSSCEPCPMCLGAIYWARLEKVFYACSREDAAAANFDDSFIYDEIALSPSSRSITMQCLDLPNATRPFELWKDFAGKVLY